MIAGLASLLLAALQPAPAEPLCTAATAHRTTVEEIGANADRWTGRCVTVSGVMSSIAMFGSVEGLYETQRYGADGNPDPAALRRHRIGLYSASDEIRGFRGDEAGLPHIEVTGTVDTCQRMAAAARAAAPDSIIMMGGYCHYNPGAVVRAAAVRIDASRGYRRLTGEEARARVGNLVASPADWPQLPALRELGERFRAAIAGGDHAALAEMHGMGELPLDPRRMQLEAMLGARDSVFAQLRRNPSLPMAIFLDRRDVERARAGTPPEAPIGTICFCRTRNCSGRWPIARSDADNAPSRPYACTSTAWVDWRARRIGTQTPISGGGWLAEPPQSAFRR